MTLEPEPGSQEYVDSLIAYAQSLGKPVIIYTNCPHCGEVGTEEHIKEHVTECEHKEEPPPK
ncbi:hypothetical protein LCGC14_0781750 [marine sediment metagenome]|uniref:Uncharacterized protein n=1 Tax=marine sediment metagenome TaxID=412755 RepID=A0A0F9T2B7_9ZZZZ